MENNVFMSEGNMFILFGVIVLYVSVLFGIILFLMIFYRFLISKLTKSEKQSKGNVFNFMFKMFKYSFYLLLFIVLIIFFEPIIKGLFGF